MSDRRRYRKYPAKPKLELVLASFRGDRSVAEIRREHDISGTLLRRWPPGGEDGADGLQEGQERSLAAEQRRRTAELERTSGKKTYELEIAGKLLLDWE